METPILNKLQITNPKFQINYNNKIPMIQTNKIEIGFGAWSLRFICSLVLGIWDFYFKRSMVCYW
jgi:hypothetical protein